MNKGGVQKGGAALEKTVMVIFKHYEQRNIHCQQNFPEQLITGQKVRKHGFDFQILYQGKFIAFDAKHCNGPLFYLSNCKAHQIKAMHDIEKNGGEGFFLVYYAEKSKLNKVPVNHIMDCLEKNYKSIMYNEEFDTKIDILGILK